MGSISQKPLLVFTANPVEGHLAPLVGLATELIARGYEIVFMTDESFKSRIEGIGAEYWGTVAAFTDNVMERRLAFPVGIPRLLFDLEEIFLKKIVPRMNDFKALLEMLHERDPNRKIVIVHETTTMGVLPFKFGAPLPKGYTKFPKVININPLPLVLNSVNTAPFGTGLPPDYTEGGMARNKLLTEMFNMGPLAGINKTQHEILKAAGCTTMPTTNALDSWLEFYDTCFQMCTPALEYYRSDMHPSIRFAGTLPKRPLKPDTKFPDWWPEVLANSKLPLDSPDRKKVIFVAQGTVATDINELIVPTIKGLADRSDLLVLATLGVKDKTLPDDVSVPSNTRVADWVPYDAALEHADVFVSNAGYGGMVHGVNNGTPMVMAGITEDKVEVSARAEHAGFAVNLRTQTPTAEQVAAGVEKVLSNPSYKIRAVRHMQENQDMDSVGIVEREILKYAAME